MSGPALRVEIVEVDRRRLAVDELLLGEVYSVLATAHYRSSPNDLQLILEAPGHRLLVAFAEGRVAGALDAVREPREGLRGSGVVPDIFERMGWGSPGAGYRIVRIAVAPCVQRRGVGSALVARLKSLARSEGLDWIGASFGHLEPLPFWVKVGFTPVHVSPRFNPATGEKNVVVVKPLSKRAEERVRIAACSLLNRLAYSGSSVYRDVPAESIAWLLRGAPCGCPAPRLDEEQARRLRLFLEARLALESVHDALLLETLRLASRCVLQRLDIRDLTLVSLLVLQGKPVYEASKLLGVERDEAEERLRRIYAAAQPSGE